MFKRGGIGFFSLFIINPLIIIAFQNFTIAKDNTTIRMTQTSVSKSSRSPASVLTTLDHTANALLPCPAPKKYESGLE